MRRRYFCVVVSSFLAGCSASGLSESDTVATDVERDEPSDQGGGNGGELDSGVSDGAADVFAWWRLDADLSIDGGDLTPAGSALQAAMLDPSGVELCVIQGVAGTVTPVLTLPDELLVAWWSLEDIEWSGGCVEELEDAVLPAAFSVGVGVLHPEIVAVLDGMPEATGAVMDSLNGAYAQFDDGGTIYVFGAVGPSEAWAGAGGAAEDAPLMDGTWELRGAYGFPL